MELDTKSISILNKPRKTVIFPRLLTINHERQKPLFCPKTLARQALEPQVFRPESLPMEKSLNGEEFKKFVQEQLVPKLWKGAVLVMDNLKVHKVEGVEEMIEAVGASVVYLSPYSPEFNPIEHLWWELKAWLRRFVPRSVEIVEKLLKLGVKLCSSKQIENYFAHCCYCTS